MIRGLTKSIPRSHFRWGATSSFNNVPKISIVQRRLNFSTPQVRAVRGWGTVINLLAGAYIGALLVCGGSLYFMYHDANERQHIPFELKFRDQITAVEAINKDDVLKSPRYAAKYYRKLLIDLAREESDSLDFDEENHMNKYSVPLISSEKLVYEKSRSFANFYIDILLRYAKSLLAKGNLDASVNVLSMVIDDDMIFYNLGDSERLSQCCRLLSRVTPDSNTKLQYIKRAIDMQTKSFPSVILDGNYLLQDGSLITDELLNCLNALAFYMTNTRTNAGLTKALNIYIANLKTLDRIVTDLEMEKVSQISFPLFNCDPTNLLVLKSDIRAHISEIMWAKGYHHRAIAWSEEVIDDLYIHNSNTAAAGPILKDVLSNLIIMSRTSKDSISEKRYRNLLQNLTLFEGELPTWYDEIIERFSIIIYSRGPLGIIEKPLLERFSKPVPLPLIEELDTED